MAEQLDKAYELQKLFRQLLDKEDPKLDDRKKCANVTAKMDKKYGRKWREVVNPPGVELVDLKEGGDDKEKDNSFFEKMRAHMLENEMPVGKLVDVADLGEMKEHKEEKPLHETIQISISRRG